MIFQIFSFINFWSFLDVLTLEWGKMAFFKLNDLTKSLYQKSINNGQPYTGGAKTVQKWSKIQSFRKFYCTTLIFNRF